MFGPSKKQKIAKMVKEDEEIAIEMLKEKEKEQIDWKRIAHHFGIHNYSKVIKADNKNKVVKCSECSKLHCTSIESKIYYAIAGIILLFMGAILGPIGIFIFLLNLTNFKALAFGIGGLFCLYISIKRGIERIWMGL